MQEFPLGGQYPSTSDVPAQMLPWVVPRKRRAPRPRTWFFALELGVRYERLYDLGGFGASGLVAAEHEGESLDVSIGVLISAGDLSGLTLTQVGPNFGLDARLGPVRLGACTGFGVNAISTRTAVDGAAVALTFDICGRATLDLAHFGGPPARGMYIGAKLGASVVVAPDAQPTEWGPTIFLGVRL